MRPLSLLISTLFIWTSSHAQLEKVKGTWITPSQETIFIGDTGELHNDGYLSNARLQDSRFELFIYGDTLSFQRRYYSSADDNQKLYIDRFDLKILSLSDSTIKVKLASKKAKEFFGNKSILNLKRQEYTIDTSIHFKKVVFHTSECYGSCPTYHLEISSNKTARLYAEEVYRSFDQRDTTAEGYFEGVISDGIYQKLINSIRTCNLRTLKMNNVQCCDGSIITMVVYYNNKRNYYKTMTPPTIANELVQTLYDICKTHNFQRTTKQFTLEK